MNPLLNDMIARKRDRRRELAALPVGEKLRMLEQILTDTKGIAATHPDKPTNPLKVKIRKNASLILP